MEQKYTYKIIKKLFYFKTIFCNFNQKHKNRKFISKVLKIKKQVKTFIDKNDLKEKKRILFSCSFSINMPNKLHDFLLAESLILRGAEIIPLICGGVQQSPCTVFGGVWGGFTSDESKNELIGRKNCQRCIKSDCLLWREWVGIDPVFLSKYLSNDERLRLNNIVGSYDFSNYKNWKYDGICVGKHILKTLRNNELVQNEKLINDYEKLLKKYLYNIVVVIESFKKALDDIKPDCIVSNNSFYFPWSVFEILARRKNISFHNCSIGGKRKSCIYSTNKKAAPFNNDIAWESWASREFSENEYKLVKKYIKESYFGINMTINTADPKKNSDFIPSSENYIIDFSKPTALLPANVLWDAAVLDSDTIFDGMTLWIVETIKFFEENPQWQLIVKPHPAEENKFIPKTRELVLDQIKKYKKKLPDNIILLPAINKFKVYDFFDYIKFGIVYTTTVGLEMVCHGIPVITSAKGPYSGKGFTFDAKSKDEYFKIIKNLFENGISLKRRNLNIFSAKRFYYFYNFVYYTDLNLSDWSFNGLPSLNVSGVNDLLPGKNLVLDYVCDSIMNDMSLMNEKRWPPVVRKGKIITESHL